jgi:GTP-binding protein
MTRIWSGHMMMVHTDDMIVAPHLVNIGINEPHNTRILVSLIKPGDVFVDVGANVGYFSVLGEPTQFRLVDMPGYGFAKAPVKVVERWKQLVRTYLRGRAVLKRTLVLVDARHGLKPVDREMLTMLDEAAVGYRLVLTKADKMKASELGDVVAATEAEARKHPAAYPQVHATSAEKGLGIADLRGAVLADVQA